MPDKDYTVFTNDPTTPANAADALPDDWWEAHGPISARTDKAAIEKLRDAVPDLKANADILYFAVANLRPRKMIREIIEKFSLGYADEDQPGGGGDAVQERLS